LKAYHLFSNAVRAKEIATVLAKYGFGELLEQAPIPRALVDRLAANRRRELNLYQRIRLACEELGPTFIKLGQILSARPDVLPAPLIVEFKLLRDAVKAQPFEAMRKVIDEELDGELDNVFSEFNATPAACGSLAQVYQARLRATGERVAVKVQRPDIRKAIRADMDMVTWLAGQIHRNIEELQPFDLPVVIEQAREGLVQELDFTNEARNMLFFNANNPAPQEIFAPQVIETLSTRRVLVTQWVDGVSPTRAELDTPVAQELARAGGRSVFHQIMISGFFHADPHTGNVFVTPDERLCLIDWGLAGQLTKSMRFFLADLFKAIARGEPAEVVNAVAARAEAEHRVDTVALEKEVTVVLRKHRSFETRREAMGTIMIELLYVFGKHGIHLAKDYALLAKAVISIEEVGRTLDPSFDIRTVSDPFLKLLTRERYSPRSMRREGFWSLLGLVQQLREVPAEFQRVLRQVEEGRFKIQFDHKGLESLEDEIDQATSRLTIAIIIGALLISSAIIVQAELRPHILGVSALGFAGFTLSAVMGFWVVIDILRHGRHK